MGFLGQFIVIKLFKKYILLLPKPKVSLEYSLELATEPYPEQVKSCILTQQLI